MTKLSIPGSLGRESVGARNKLDNVLKATFLADVFDCRVVPAVCWQVMASNQMKSNGSVASSVVGVVEVKLVMGNNNFQSSNPMVETVQFFLLCQDAELVLIQYIRNCVKSSPRWCHSKCCNSLKSQIQNTQKKLQNLIATIRTLDACQLTERCPNDVVRSQLNHWCRSKKISRENERLCKSLWCFNGSQTECKLFSGFNVPRNNLISRVQFQR